MVKKDTKTIDGQTSDNCQEQIDDLTNRWKRALADYQNLERRYQKEKTDFIQFANANLILKLVGVLGHLEKAAESLNDEGLKMIVSEFRKVLSEEGLEEIEALGKEFNPEFMEAVDVVSDGKESENEGKVAEVLAKGYLLKRKLLVPAKVKVFKFEKTTKDQLLKNNQ